MSAVLYDDIPEDFPRPDSELREHKTAHLRVPPHSIEAESSVLGGILLDNAAWDQVGDLLVEGDFYRYEHRTVFAVVGALINATKPADVITVYERLKSMGKADEIGGLAYLNSLAQYMPSASNIRRYAEIVREQSILRKLVAASDEIATAAFNPQGRAVDSILDEAEQRIFNIAENGGVTEDFSSIDDSVVQLLDDIQERFQGGGEPDYVPTGIHEVDERLDGGVRGGEVVVIGARPSMGKSAMAQTIEEHVALQLGLPVLAFSLEMPRKQKTRRHVASIGRIHLQKLRLPERMRDEDWPKLTEAVEKLRQVSIEINDQSSLNINQLRRAARKFKRKYRTKLGLITVDYLGLMDGLDPKMSRTYQLAEITKGLKSLAKELGWPIVLLVQIDRGVEKRDDPMPRLSDLRDSGAIEQDADIVFFIHRPWKHDPTLADEWKPYAKGYFAKLRDGDPGYVDLYYDGPHLHFKSWPIEFLNLPTSKVRTPKGTNV
jgi:replicative DNA helicase